MSTAVLIPVRGGSKGIPRKNLRLVGGRPLVDHTVLAALAARGVDSVVVSTDDDEIAAHVADAFPAAVVHRRSAATATDAASTESVMLEVADAMPEVSTWVLVQATSPLTTAADLDGALGLLAGADSVVAVVRQKRFRWEEAPGGAVPVGFDPVRRPRRQDHDGMLIENGAVYVTSTAGLRASGCRVNGAVALWVMPEETYLEIDEPSDLLLVDVLLRARGPLHLDLGAVRLVITDVDGVLTDNGMYYSTDGPELKKFSARDGKGFELLRRAGVATMLLTSERGAHVEARARKLQADECVTGSVDKRAEAQVVVDARGLTWAQVAFVGDDVHDLGLLEVVGVPACPADAMPVVRRAAALVLEHAGGDGAFRELADRVVAAVEGGR